MHILSIFTYLHKLHFIHSTVMECDIYCIFVMFYYVHCCLLVSDIVWNNLRYILLTFFIFSRHWMELGSWNVNISNNNNETFKNCTSSEFLHNNEHPHITPNNMGYCLTKWQTWPTTTWFTWTTFTHIICA